MLLDYNFLVYSSGATGQKRARRSDSFYEALWRTIFAFVTAKGMLSGHLDQCYHVLDMYETKDLWL